MTQRKKTRRAIAVSVLIVASLWAGAAASGAVAPGEQSSTGAISQETSVTETATEGSATETTVAVATEAETTAAGTTAAGPAGATFANNTVTANRGDIATIEIDLAGTDRAQLRIGSMAVNYLATFTVVDGDGDGTVTVTYDTFVAGQDSTVSGISAGEGDEIRDYRLATEPLASPLDPAIYDMNLSVDGTETDIGSLLLAERSTGPARTWIAPADADVESASAIEAAATENGTVAQGDQAIVEVEASGLYASLNETSDLTNGSNGLSFSVTQTDLGPNQAARNVSLEDATLVTDPANDRFFVVLDTSEIEANSTYEATFEIDDANPLLAEGEVQNASTTFTVVPRQVSFDGATNEGVVQVPAGGNATLSGSSTLAPGSEFTVQVRSTGESPFLDRAIATVGSDRTWSVDLDVGDAPPGTEFDVIVEAFNVTRPGVVIESAGTAETTGAATTAAETTSGGTTEAGTTGATETTAAETTETTTT